MNSKLAETIETFQSIDPELRTEVLLDYSKKLPPLPEALAAKRDAGLNRVHECQTPVFLFVEVDGDGHAHLFVDVAEEAPTVKGYLAILVEALNGAPVEDFAALPDDLLEHFQLGHLIRMQRVIGLTAILQRIKREVAAAAIKASTAEASNTGGA